MLEIPEARAKLRRKLETWPDDRKSPITINQGLELLDLVERLEKEANWLSLSLSKRGNTEIFCCPENEPYKPIMECVAEHGSCANCWREAARKAVSEADNA